MALQGEILFKDVAGSIIQGEREDGSSLVHEFKFSVNKPDENANHRHSGIRRVNEFWVIKDIDQLSPALLEALANNQRLEEVKITLFRIELELGERKAYFEYTLSEARIVSIENWMPPVHTPETEQIGNMERVGLMAGKFTLTDLTSGRTYMMETYGIE